jgi:tryptophan synthase beta chain
MQLHDLPDARGHFGPYGGVFVAETLIRALDELKAQYASARRDPAFAAEFEHELKHYVGRPSPVYHAERWSRELGGAQIWLKREDLNHTGAHKVNNCIGQALLARRLRKPRVIAETGAGMHGVAAATVAARYGLECVVYMGSEDVRRQVQNVYRMKLLGATVVPVESGSRTLKDALNEAMRDWVTNVDTTFYIIGTVAGPHPYPMMVRDFQSVIGRECLAQMPEAAGRQPDVVIACVGGGSNAMGIFYPYLAHAQVKLVGVEAAGEGIETGRHAASLTAGRPGVLHGNRTYLLQNDDGQIVETHSVSAGLDYPGVGPEHAWLKDTGRAEYVSITDDEALAAFHRCCRTEGILPALESAHALAYAAKLAPTLPKDRILLVNLSGRGDKDMATVAERSGLDFSLPMNTPPRSAESAPPPGGLGDLGAALRSPGSRHP